MTAFVTGGSGGIGKAICKTLYESGYAVAVGYNTDKQTAQAIAKEINGLAVHCDVTDISSMKNAVSMAKEKLDSITLLVNNAGVADVGLFTDLTKERLEHIISADLTGAMLMSQLCLPDMIHLKKGSIINISSMWGETGASCEVAYSAAKAGLIGFTKALAKEEAPSGIRVNCITAGMIDTKMNACFSADEIADIVDEIPISRIGTPQDIANAVAFLASDKASYITGAVLKVNGGMCV